MKFLCVVVPACMMIVGCGGTEDVKPKAVEDAPIVAVKQHSKNFDRAVAAIEDEKSGENLANPAAALVEKHLKAALAWQNDYRNATKEDRPAVMKQRPSYSEYFTQFKQLADKHPNTPIAASAHGWMARSAPEQKDKSASLKALVENHVDSDVLAETAIRLTSFATPTKELEERLKQIVERSSNSTVKAAAIYALLRTYDSATDWSKRIAAGDPRALRLKGGGRKYVEGFSVETSELESLYTSLAGDYREVDVKVMGRSVNIGDIADAGLFKLRSLSIGSIAPDIVGEDLDGVEFKLSDYRGKVVMLGFWGHW